MRSASRRAMARADGRQSTYGPLKTGVSPYGFPAMSMKRVPGCASTTLSAPPAPRTAICERLARRVLVPKLTSPSSLALPELVFADPFRVPHAAARSELQERSGLQPRALHRATWTGAVAGTGRARDQVPQVVEP